jgi:pSer/pThr/pTyr-binding forkhead associated (FHA) protein
MRAVTWVSGLLADLEAAWEAPHVPVLALPAAHDTPVAIGRSRACGCVVAEPSVSRQHAQLRRAGDAWLLRDLGSRNGTRVNRMRVSEEVEVRPGDRVSFGGVAFVLGRPPRATTSSD